MIQAIYMYMIITLNLPSMEASSVLDMSEYASTTGNVTIRKSWDSSSPILISSDGSYSWQFYPYHNDGHMKEQYLLVVLNTMVNTTTIVWMANRNHPVSSETALVYALPSRQFILRDRGTADDPSSTILWSSPEGVFSVEMNATGNLIMRDARHSALWQSFEHPLDIMVAGQSLRAHQTLVSRVSSEDVSAGRYTLKVEPGGVVFYATLDEQQKNVPYELLTYSGTDATGSSGGNLSEALHSWCNQTYIVYEADGVQLSLKQEGYNITPECESETGGFTFHGVAFSTRSGGMSGLRYFKLMPDGSVRTFLVSDSDGLVIPLNEPTQGFFSTHCKLPSYCGINSLCSSYQTCSCPDLFQAISASDPSKGCRLVSEPLDDCSGSTRHEFLEIPWADYFANSYIPPVMDRVSPEECKDLCLPNCSCTAAFHNNDTGACYLYNQVHTMQSDTNPSITAFLKVPSSSNDISPGFKFPTYFKYIVIAVCFVLLAIGILGLWVGKKSNKWPKKNEKNRRMRRLDLDLEEEAFLGSLPSLPPRYSYKELHLATQGFSKRLGRGGSGSVYEGRITVCPVDSYKQQFIVEDGRDEHDIDKVMAIVAVKELEVTLSLPLFHLHAPIRMALY